MSGTLTSNILTDHDNTVDWTHDVTEPPSSSRPCNLQGTYDHV